MLQPLLALPPLSLVPVVPVVPFTGAMTTIRDWFEGDLGRLIAVAALGIGLAIGVIQQSIMAVVVGFAMALALSQGPGVVVALLGGSLPM